MNRLNGTDASFLYAETARMPMHIGSVQLIDVPNDRRATFFDDVKALYRARADRLRYIDHRLTQAPLQLDHPRWTACDVDFDEHLQRIEVRPPGDIAQLERVVADLHATPLDRSRPLWKTYYIDGLEHGRAAYFNVIHHACLDGVSGQAAVDALTDPTPSADSAPPPRADRDVPDQKPLGDWVDAGFDSLLRAARGIDAAMRLSRRALTTMQRRGPAAWVAPVTPINRAIGPLRTYAMLRISLTDTRAIGKSRNCSINDVLLTLCGGALRRYLSMRGALPDRELIAGVPVSTRDANDQTLNTQVSMMRVGLATHLDDPLERLAAIHAAVQEAKSEAHDVAALTAASPRLPALPWFGRAAATLWDATGAADWVAPWINLVISNVPGPRAIRYSSGARMLTHFPVSIPAHGAALNITAQSYAEHFDIGITACAQTVPDVVVLRDALRGAYIELRTRVLRRGLDVRELQRALPDVERRCGTNERLVA
jgi:diacylglycerol O-acyltransferase / wax synthase